MDPLNPHAKGARTLTAILDRWREVKPDKIFASQLRSTGDSFDDWTMRDVANASDAWAWHLSSTIGTSDKFETLAYIGVNDLRYAAFLYGAIKAGYKMLLMSPKNPPAQNASLMQQTECHHLFHSEEMAGIIKDIKSVAGSGVKFPLMQPFKHWVNAFTKPYPHSKSFEDAKWDPIIVAHSSGSTGPPKPIVVNQGYMASSEMPLRQIPGREPAGKSTFDFPGGGNYFCTFPLCHLAGLNGICMYPVTTFESTAVLALPDRPPTALLAKQVIDAKDLKVLYTPPSIIEGIFNLEGGVDSLCNVRTIMFAGGPLSPDCGNALSKNVKLTTLFGSSELGAAHMLIPSQEDWSYFEFHPDYGAIMEPSVDGASELILRNDNPQAVCRGLYWAYPDQVEFRTRDMFMPHPTKPDLWTFYGRNDDIIVFSNGAKYNPVPAESAIGGHPKLTGALVAGDGKTQAAVLLEAKDATTADPTDEIWAHIAKVNKDCQKQGQLTRNMISVVPPRSFVRAPKGTIVRRETYNKFQDVIQTLYAGQTTQPAPLYNVQDTMVEFVKKCTDQISHIAGIGYNDDFYIRGLDSIQTLELVQVLVAGLRPQYSELEWLTGQLIFDYSSIQKLAAVLSGRLDPSEAECSSAAGAQSAFAAMDSMVEKYSAPSQLQQRYGGLIRPWKEGRHVLLTGSTGFLGMRILQSLLVSAEISHIHCLDRGADAKTRVLKMLQSRNDLQSRLGKLTFHTARFTERHLGLDEREYNILLEQVDVIIHNAWAVNFNHSLASFEQGHIRGVSQLLHLASNSKHTPLFVFISSGSSIAAFPCIHGPNVPVPESIISTSAAAIPMGYAQSKQVAERILESAAQAGIPASILRVGQIAGPIASTSDVGPVWNPAEWVPALLISSKKLGCVPLELPHVDWLPVNVVGAAVVQIAWQDASSLSAGTEEPYTARVYHVLNQHLTAWDTLALSVQRRFGGADAMPVVPLASWIERLTAVNTSDPLAVQDYPALKILAFFEAVLASPKESKNLLIDKQNALSSSEAVRSAGRITTGMLATWMEGWGL